jgi:hypothetical protein
MIPYSPLSGELPMPLARHHKGMKVVAATDAFFVGEGYRAERKNGLTL